MTDQSFYSPINFNPHVPAFLLRLYAADTNGFYQFCFFPPGPLPDGHFHTSLPRPLPAGGQVVRELTINVVE